MTGRRSFSEHAITDMEPGQKDFCEDKLGAYPHVESPAPREICVARGLARARVAIANRSRRDRSFCHIPPEFGLPSHWSSLFLIFVAIRSVPLVAQDVPASEYAARRTELLRRLPDGVTLLHSESADKSESQPSFIQNPTFFYFTGQHGLPSAVLALDGPAHETVLFLPPVPSAFGFRVEGVVPEPGSSAAALGVSRTVPWDSLADYLRARLAAGVTK